MNAIFEEELREGWLIIYMDDMLVATHDNPEFHRKCVHRILHKLLVNDLYLMSPALGNGFGNARWTGVSSGNRPKTPIYCSDVTF